MAAGEEYDGRDASRESWSKVLQVSREIYVGFLEKRNDKYSGWHSSVHTCVYLKKNSF